MAWPPTGYVPRPVVYARWSFFLPYADFGAATVQMHLDGCSVNASIIHADTAGRPSVNSTWNSIVWEPSLDLQGLDWSTPHSVQVTIANIKKQSGVVRDFTYEMMLFNPAQ